MRFDLVSGDFRFITTPPGAATETLATSVTVVTDQAGLAQARLRVTAGAANQTALLRITDLGSGAFQNASFLIAQSTGSSPGFFVIPDTLTFTGPNNASCASNVSAEAVIFGGVPPYAVSGAGTTFNVSPSVVTYSGGSFGILALGVCTDGLPVVVQDASGHTATVTVANKLGTVAAPPLVVAPDRRDAGHLPVLGQRLDRGRKRDQLHRLVGQQRRLRAPRGREHGLDLAHAEYAGDLGTSASVTVSVSDGVSTAPITVTLGGEAAGACPAPLGVSPTTVTLNGCTSRRSRSREATVPISPLPATPRFRPWSPLRS